MLQRPLRNILCDTNSPSLKNLLLGETEEILEALKDYPQQLEIATNLIKHPRCRVLDRPTHEVELAIIFFKPDEMASADTSQAIHGWVIKRNDLMLRKLLLIAPDATLIERLKSEDDSTDTDLWHSLLPLIKTGIDDSATPIYETLWLRHTPFIQAFQQQLQTGLPEALLQRVTGLMHEREMWICDLVFRMLKETLRFDLVGALEPQVVPSNLLNWLSCPFDVASYAQKIAAFKADPIFVIKIALGIPHVYSEIPNYYYGHPIHWLNYLLSLEQEPVDEIVQKVQSEIDEVAWALVEHVHSGVELIAE